MQDGDDESGSPQKTLVKNENETETANNNKQPAQDIPLQENSLLVDISDALSEKDRVKFTVHTRTTLPVSYCSSDPVYLLSNQMFFQGYAKSDFLVVRQHEEFVWLHDRFEENDEYAGYIIPPVPPRPDFDASREKLQRLGEGEGNMTKEE